MKKVLLIIAYTLTATAVFADEKSNALLAALQKEVAGWGDYRIEFTVAIDTQLLEGSFEVSGDSYRVTTHDVVLFCDGTTKYEVNLLDEEVLIDRVDPADRTVMGNPTRMFDFLDGSYTHRYLGAALVRGVNCERIELRETASKDPQTIDVFISAETGLPVRVGYTIGLMSTEAAVDVVHVTPRIAIDRTVFTFDPGRYLGFEIIDFR